MERASIFEAVEQDVDLSKFTVKPAAKKAAPPPEEDIRAVSEAANFKSREPVKPPAAKKPPVSAAAQRRHRTGRNIQMNLKVDAATRESFYEIMEGQGWVSGETLKYALEALKAKLAAEKR